MHPSKPLIVGAWARGTTFDGVAPALFAALAVVCIVAYQGGYFPTSWGWSTIALLSVLLTWTIVSGRTDAGQFDLGFMLALVLLTGWVGCSIAWSRNPAQSVLELERGDPANAAASFRQAISIDSRDWQAWLSLAASAQGCTRARAIARARALYPRSPEIVEFLNELHELKPSQR